MKNLYYPTSLSVSFIFSFLLVVVIAKAHAGDVPTSISLKEIPHAAGQSTGAALAKLRTNLYGVYADNTTYIADGILNNYADFYSNDIDDDDAVKLPNPGANLSIKRCNQFLVIERRHTIAGNDTIFLNLTGTKAQRYRFECIAANIQPNLIAYLQDSYLQTKTLLNLTGTTTLDFSVANTTLSNAADRFMIVLMPATILPLAFTSVKAYRQNQHISVEWTTANESNLKKYDVEKSSDGNHYTTVYTTPAGNTAVNTYSWLDAQPVTGNNYYRVKSTGINGEIQYSQVMKVLIESSNQKITVYPNPVVNNTINLHLVNHPAGNYAIKLLNIEGQQVLTTTIKHEEGSSVELIPIAQKLPKGIYQLQVFAAGQSMVTNTLFL